MGSDFGTSGVLPGAQIGRAKRMRKTGALGDLRVRLQNMKMDRTNFCKRQAAQ